MKNQWLAYVVVAVISVLAGVAIAGTPNSTPNSPTIVVTATTVTEVTTTVPAVEETLPPSTVPDTTEPPVDVETTTTSAPETTTTVPPVDRAAVVVVAVNGAGTVGIAGRTRDELVDLGYVAARATDGAVVETSAVYFYEGFEREAEEVSLDLGLDPSRIRPVDEAPEFGALPGDEVIAYIGSDRA